MYEGNVNGLKMDKINSTKIEDSDDENNIDNFEIINEKKENNELNNYKEILTGLIYSIQEILDNNFFKLLDEDSQKLKDLVDDTILWIHIKEKIMICDYISKINEVNNICNTIVDKYKNEEFELNNLSNKNELEDLCYSLKGGLESNLFNVSDNLLKLLEEEVNKTIDWLNKDKIYSSSEYKEKIDFLNNLCDNIYNNMLVKE